MGGWREIGADGVHAVEGENFRDGDGGGARRCGGCDREGSDAFLKRGRGGERCGARVGRGQGAADFPEEYGLFEERGSARCGGFF